MKHILREWVWELPSYSKSTLSSMVTLLAPSWAASIELDTSSRHLGNDVPRDFEIFLKALTRRLIHFRGVVREGEKGAKAVIQILAKRCVFIPALK